MSETENQESLFAELLDFIHEHGDKSFPSQPHRKSTVQEYLGKLVQAVSDIDEKTFEAELSPEAQDWANNGINALNDQKEVELPEGFEPPATSERQSRRERRGSEKTEAAAGKAEAGAAEGNGADSSTKESRAAARAARKAAKAEGGGEKGHKMRTPKTGFTTRSLRKLVIQNPNISLDEMAAEAKKAGTEFARSTLTVVRQSALITCSIVKECGWTPPKDSPRTSA
jgi:hypothetical protein